MKHLTNLDLYGHLALELGADNDSNGEIANVDTTDISFLRFTGSNPIIHGLDPGYSNSNNKVLIITFVPTSNSGTLTFKHLSNQNDLDAFRIKTPNGEDYIVPINYGSILIYDSYDNFWHIVGEAKLAAGNNGEIQFNNNGALKGSNRIIWNNNTNQLSVSGTFKINEYTFPVNDGNSNQILATDGNGNLSFVEKSPISYSNYNFGNISTSTSINLGNVETMSYFTHTNSSNSVITLTNGVIGKTYKIIGNSNGKNYSFSSIGVIRWPSNISPVISSNGKSDLFIFECVGTNKYLGQYILNYDSENLF